MSKSLACKTSWRAPDPPRTPGKLHCNKLSNTMSAVTRDTRGRRRPATRGSNRLSAEFKSDCGALSKCVRLNQERNVRQLSSKARQSAHDERWLVHPASVDFSSPR